MMNEHTNRRHGVGYWCCWAVLVLVLYVGSQGPVIYVWGAWGVHHGPEWFWNWTAIFYHPLNLWCRNDYPGGALIDDYGNWWLELAQPSSWNRDE